MKKRKTFIIIGIIAIIMVFSGATVLALSDNSNYDPNKEYRCPGVCKIQDVFDITPK